MRTDKTLPPPHHHLPVQSSGDLIRCVLDYELSPVQNRTLKKAETNALSHFPVCCS